ncbi:cytochrome c [Oceaniferula spumae]|uniref:Cytochrome c n=1 Tax=Oceaniferula spumae TaxID=2979115 RepID=A0AAT9FLM5_9BACT
MFPRFLIPALAINAFISPSIDAGEKLSYNRDVRPILSDKCFHCHGPDSATREPDDKPLRLDSFEGATADRGGYNAITPGEPDKSEMIYLIFSDDESEQMPPPKSHRSLTDAQKKILHQWVKEGAVYEKHWAFVPPKQPTPPVMKGSNWPKNDIDRFVLNRLTEKKLQPSDQADKATLIRRATLSVTGLQPTPAEVDQFLADSSPDAYSKLLDRLLESPRYGENMAYEWIEAARYADTDGYQNDGGRTMWPWRDWVIKAFNDNMPYDQFTIRQIAGDMLPGGDQQNLLASAFNRNHRINNEGGALPEEFIVEYAVDRVETTSAIWMGLTYGCARCHDHKYDPISHKDFFRFYAYFNNVPEKGKDAGAKAQPFIKIASPIYKDDKTIKQITAIEDQLKATASSPELKQRQQQWQQQITTAATGSQPLWRRAKLEGSTISPAAKNSLVEQPDGSLLNTNTAVDQQYTLEFAKPALLDQLATVRLEVIQDDSMKKPLHFSNGTGGDFLLTEFTIEIKKADGSTTPVPLSQAETPFSKIGFAITNIIDHKEESGWGVEGYRAGVPITVFINTAKTLSLQQGDRIIVRMSHAGGHPIGKFRLSFHGQPNANETTYAIPAAVAAALTMPEEKRDANMQAAIDAFYLSIDPVILKLQAQRQSAEKQLSSLAVNVPVMKEKPNPAPTYLLERGQYNAPDKSEALSRSVPLWLHDSKTQPTNRLELARWLVSEKNPLAARVMVNRVWQHHFGTGLVKTADNFGLQGELPSHPDLLDWLAVDFMNNGWDIKRLHKLILSSATWQQKSEAAPAVFVADPDNRLLARGPRFRLSATAIRDTALFAGGLLHEQLGGPPVKPYQPAGMWKAMAHTAKVTYKPSTGTGLYRRDLYTYWKRAVNPPRMILFDAATRDYCSVIRNSTNTPLQALTLMNDVTFVEAARGLGERMLKHKASNPDERLKYGFRLATGRFPDSGESAAIKECWLDFARYYQSKPEEAAELLKHGASKRDKKLNVSEYAAYMSAAHLMLNMDSTIHIE